MTYLQHYEDTMEPKLKEIDTFIRTEDPITVNTISNLLSISEYEIHKIIKEEGISLLNKVTFFNIMKKGSSSICKLFNRELERNTFNHYSIDDVSYIYEIPTEKVLEASYHLDIKIFNSKTIRDLFSKIEI